MDQKTVSDKVVRSAVATCLLLIVGSVLVGLDIPIKLAVFWRAHGPNPGDIRDPTTSALMGLIGTTVIPLSPFLLIGSGFMLAIDKIWGKPSSN